MAITPQKHAFIAAVARGSHPTDAAIEAGYSPESARKQASRLMRDEQIADAIRRTKEANLPPLAPVVDDVSVLSSPGADQSDPLVHMANVMNDTTQPASLRLEAARALAQYVKAKPGSAGAKVSAKDRAAALMLSKPQKYMPQPPKSVIDKLEAEGRSVIDLYLGAN